MTRILAFLDQSIQAKQPAYVHCLGGKGRTGVVVACHFIERGDDYFPSKRDLAEEALKLNIRLRQGQGVPDAEDSPQTKVQYKFVRNWIKS